MANRVAGMSRVAGARRVAGRTLTVVAAVAVLVVLLLPRGSGGPAAFVGIPVEALVGVGLLLVVPARTRPAVTTVLGVTLGLLAVLAALDAGFRATLARPFDPVVDAPLLGDGWGLVTGSLGPVAVTGVVTLVVAVPVLVLLAVRRLGGVVARRRGAAAGALGVLTAVWVICALLGAQLVPGVPVAAAGAAVLARDTAAGVPVSLRDRAEFAALAAADPYRGRDDLLGALRGKDVVVAFVESYGRSAVEDPRYAPRVGAVLDDGTDRLTAAGFGARSAYLTSPIVGGGSWLAHATFHSGLPVDDEQRYRGLLASERLSLPGAFRDAGWHTTAIMPGTTGPWPEGRFYGYDETVDLAALDYRGPDLGWGTVPDQFTLAAFERLAGASETPVMAEISLLSSHAPWRFVPPLLDWARVGDGSVYHDVAGPDPAPAPGIGTDESRTRYRESIEYSVRSLVSYVETHGDDDLVLVLLGDHQPVPAVTGAGAGRDVPISVVTRDRAVLDRISPWAWDAGLRPGPDAPVWPMESFRDRFLDAFG